MSDNLVAVFADEIYAGVLCGNPFAVGRIDGHIVDLFGVKQIVGIVGTIVTRHFQSGDTRGGVGGLARIGNLERTGSRAHPYATALILDGTGDTVAREGLAVLIYHIGDLVENVIRCIGIRTFGVVGTYRVAEFAVPSEHHIRFPAYQAAHILIADIITEVLGGYPIILSDSGQVAFEFGFGQDIVW